MNIDDLEMRAKYPSLYVDIECTKCGKLMALANAVHTDHQYLCSTCFERKIMFKETEFQCSSCPNKVYEDTGFIVDGKVFCASCADIAVADKEAKSPEIEQLLNGFASIAFGRTRDDAKKNQVCVICGGDASTFKDKLSEKEYKISRMCQKCQDGVFDYEE